MLSLNSKLRPCLFFLAFLLPLHAQAEMLKLKDKSEIVGTWILKAVAPSLKRPRIEENRVWEFRKDGIIAISGYNRKMGINSKQDVKYHIQNGSILTPQVGRPGKFMTYRVYEKTDTLMTLKGGIEGYYFFKKK